MLAMAFHFMGENTGGKSDKGPILWGSREESLGSRLHLEAKRSVLLPTGTRTCGVQAREGRVSEYWPSTHTSGIQRRGSWELGFSKAWGNSTQVGFFVGSTNHSPGFLPVDPRCLCCSQQFEK